MHAHGDPRVELRHRFLPSPIQSNWRLYLSSTRNEPDLVAAVTETEQRELAVERRESS